MVPALCYYDTLSAKGFTRGAKRQLPKYDRLRQMMKDNQALHHEGSLAGITVAVINLPHPERLIRRYMCTYKSPFFCFPPHDLLQVATCVREWTGANIVFLDAIAENLNTDEVAVFLCEHRPQFLVTLLGVESLSTDLACACSLRESVPGMRLIVFGYYATQYAEEILLHGQPDAVLRGDPESSVCEALAHLKAGISLKGIPGVAFRDTEGHVSSGAIGHLNTLDLLPPPDYSLVKIRLYSEMLLGGPFGAIATSRGCPYSCRYCTSSHDRTMLVRNVSGVVDEMQSLQESGIRVIRFLDDTFTLDKQRVVAICREIIRRGIRVTWSCLARVDSLEPEMLSWMRKAGCARVVVGVESYAPRVLETFGKRTDTSGINQRLKLINKAGIESVGFIIVGGPFESDDDFELTRKGLLDSPLDLAIIDTVALYGDTQLTEMYRNEIDFQLFPYVSRWKNPEIDAIALRRERLLFRQFYLRPRTLFKQIKNLIRFPGRSLRLFILFTRFILVTAKHKDRRDLF